MKKAKFIGKYQGAGYDKHMVYLEYEYRGKTYTVYENRAKGNEPLSDQHKSEQALIDRMLDQKQTTITEPFDLSALDVLYE